MELHQLMHCFIAICMLMASFGGYECVSSSKNSQDGIEKLMKFVGAPVDDVTTASTPARNLIVRSNLKGNIRILVNKMMTVVDMKINVKMVGIAGSNLTDYQVKYRRKLGDPNTILLEAHETDSNDPGNKLNKTSMIVIMATGWVCLAAVLCSISLCTGTIIVRKCRARRKRRYENATDSATLVGTSCPSSSVDVNQSENSDDDSEGESRAEEENEEDNEKDDSDGEFRCKRSTEYSKDEDDTSVKHDEERDERGDSSRESCATENDGNKLDNRHVDNNNSKSALKSRKYSKESNASGAVTKIDGHNGKKGNAQNSGEKKRPLIEEQHSYHDDEDYLSVHRHCEYNSFVHDSVKDVGSHEVWGLHKGSSDCEEKRESKDDGVLARDMHHKRDEEYEDMAAQHRIDLHLPKHKSNSAKSAKKKKSTALEEQNSDHNDEDYLSVHRHGEYSSFIHVEEGYTGLQDTKTQAQFSGVVASTDKRNEDRTDSSTSEDGIIRINITGDTGSSQANALEGAGQDGGRSQQGILRQENSIKVTSRAKEKRDKKEHHQAPINQCKSNLDLRVNVLETRTVNGSNIGFGTEELKSAHVLSKPKTSSSDVSSGSDVDYTKGQVRKRFQSDKGVEKAISESINAKRSQPNNGRDREIKGKAKTSERIPHRFGRAAGFSGHQTMFIVCLFTCVSISVASFPDLSLLQTATADITIEIPDGVFQFVEVFVNKDHKNSVKISGDQHDFTLNVFDVDSVAAIKTDKCKNKPGREICDIGSCNPTTGDCICPRNFNYEELFKKCIPDCSTSCPFEYYLAKSCTIKSPGKCHRCRSPCPKGQYESAACGGKMDRECTDIKKLPPVSIGENMVAEDRTKAKPAHQRLHPRNGEDSIASLNRGTGIEVVVNVLEADFDTKIGEVNNTDYDKDNYDNSMHQLCNHHVPIYYVAKRHVLKEKYYHAQDRGAHCSGKNPELSDTSVSCLGQDHDLVRLFSTTRSEVTSLKHSEGSKHCQELMTQCLECGTNCGKASEDPACARRLTNCYEDCRREKCDCLSNSCPCHKYLSSGCSGKAAECVGVTVNEITLQPVFSELYTYCHVSTLRFATYKIRTDLYANKKLIASRTHRVNAESGKAGKQVVEDDYGYMTINMPDSLKLRGKNLLIRRTKNRRDMELGHFRKSDKVYNGPESDSLTFWPNAPFSVTKSRWSKLKCDQVKLNAFNVFGKFPFQGEVPNIFKKVDGVSLREVKYDEINSYNRQKMFSVSKLGSEQFLNITMTGHKSVLRHVFTKSEIKPDGLSCKLVNKTLYWSISVEGFLKACPGSLSAKVYDQDRIKDLLFHYDFAVTDSANCFFKFEFNMPFKNAANERADKSFVLHLVTSVQTMKLVLLREKKIDRILQAIHIPQVDKGKFLNAVVPIMVVAGGFAFLLLLLLVCGALTKPRDDKSQIDRDNEFHFRHLFVIVWFVGARLAKSILFTITFLSYIFVVIHSKNYHTLKSFNEFQNREKLVLKSIYEDMEKHRLEEINRQERRFVEEKNICEINLQKLDAYLSERKRGSSWEQQVNKRAKSIKMTALKRFEENWARVRHRYFSSKDQLEARMNERFRQIRRGVNRIRSEVSSHPYPRIARILFKMYRFFGGSKSFLRYINLDVNFHGLNYYHRLESAQHEFSRLTNSFRQTRSKQENSETLNHKVWIEQTRSRIYVKPPKTNRIKYPSVNLGIGFDKDLVQNVFAVAWVIDMVKSKVLSYIGIVVMITLDLLFFIYRHTRTYAMAVMMIYGFKKICDLDKMEKDWQEDAERREILDHGLLGPDCEKEDISSSSESEECSSDESETLFERRLVGDGLDTSSDEFERRETLDRTAEERTVQTSSPSCASCTERSSSKAVDDHYLSMKENENDTGMDGDKTKGTTVKGNMEEGTDSNASNENRRSCSNNNVEQDGTEDEEEMTATMAENESRTSDECLSQSTRGPTSYGRLHLDDGCYRSHRRMDEPSMAAEAKDIAMTTVGHLGSLLKTFMTFMKKLKIVNLILLNTHVILIFFILSLAVIGVYFTMITAKFVLRTPILDELGFFDAKIAPIVTYRKVVNTRTAVNAFTINHVHIPYYEARMNARIEIYRLKAEMYKKLQCTRALLHNSEYCAWEKPGQKCYGLNAYDDGFYKNLTQFKCHITPALPRRYSNFDRVQFKNEMMRSYGPYIEAFRGLILDTFEMITAVIGIQIVLKTSAKIIFKLLLSFDLIRQIKVYQTKRPLETWNLN